MMTGHGSHGGGVDRREFLRLLGSGVVLSAVPGLWGCAGMPQTHPQDNKPPADPSPDDAAADTTPTAHYLPDDVDFAGTTALVYDERYLQHRPPTGHPEAPARLTAINDQLEESSLRSSLGLLAARPIRAEHLQAVHHPDYIQAVTAETKALEAGDHRMLSTGDVFISKESDHVSRLAAGGVLGAVDAVMHGHVDNAFCAIRPPGHHANSSRGRGFCVFNNAALAARYAQQHYGLERVLIVDWDVHHGNGTQDIFYSDASVFFFSTHQSPLYPMTGMADETGEGAGEGFTMNRPFSGGSGREEILGAMSHDLAPAMEEFKPEFIIISAGFDSRVGDPLGGFLLTDEDFADMTRLLMNIADKHAAGRIVSILEGGYNLEGLALAVESHVQTLLDKDED